jgi:hypothetical protein
VSLLSLDVQRVPRLEHGLVFAGVALLWADVANAAVAMEERPFRLDPT